MAVDIRGVDKAKLLRRLWELEEPAVAFAMAGDEPPKLTQADIDFWVKHGSVDYLCGRRIKLPIGADELSPHQYDRHHGGPGALQKVVDEVRRGEVVTAPLAPPVSPVKRRSALLSIWEFLRL